MKVLHRYVFTEVVRLFLLLLVVFILIIVMNRASFIAETILGYGVPVSYLFVILFKMIPSFLGLLIPMSLTFAVLITFFLMNGRNEIVAIKSCGISVEELLKPIFLISLVLTFLNFFSVMFVMPASNVSIKRQIQELVRKKLSLSITPGSFTSNFPGVTFYAEKVFPERGILGDFMVSVDKKNEKITIFANYGRIRMDNGTVYLDIKDGVGQFLDWNKPENLKLLNFNTYTLVVYKFVKGETFSSSKYLNLIQLIRRWNLEDKVEFFKRLAISLTPLIMGLLAFTIAASMPKGSIGTAVLLGLFMIVVYYVLYTVAKKLAMKSGFFALPLVVDFVFVVLFFVFYRRVMSEAYLE
ncbi:LptF/LptG family permease [Desulfurobacterium indicum]|uniref:Permease n=1 Tax=Desulfurobacterium indicum TaxID=1914305 RepID=A0A1R1MNN1_9BACT|nr:LptF/LptG family permease [Desulfurobacterium indicum]OMH41320.1 permease [Desulfurobacterium indicum]